MELQCDYIDFLFGYTCEVRKICRTQSGSQTILLTGSHRRGQTHNDVKHFMLIKQPLDAFPRNLHLEFPNLTRLWIEGCGLKEISKEDLIGLENIEFLFLHQNKLTSLPDDLFVNMTKLKEINFNDNKLARFSSKLLEPIETLLEFAYFKANTKINDYFDKAVKGKNDLRQLMDSMDYQEPKKIEIAPLSKPILNKSEQYQQLTTKLAEFKASGEFTNFTKQFCGKEFKVQKTLLTAKSPVFRQMFMSDDAATEKTFKNIEKFSDESFGRFLDFFYSGKVGEKVDAIEVFKLATIFDVATLKATCRDRILATLSNENALDVYNLGQHGSEKLKQQAFKVIQEIFPEVPDSMVSSPDHINKLVTAKRGIDTILG